MRRDFWKITPLLSREVFFFTALQNMTRLEKNHEHHLYTNRQYLDALQEKVLIFDGAMGTSLQKMGLTAEHFGGEKTSGCNDYLVISYPQAVETVHRSFLEVGVDVIETDTFRANRITLAEYGLQDLTVEINRQAAILARRLADEYPQDGQPRFVAGSIGPSGKLPSMNDPELSNVSFDDLADVFCEQAIGLNRRRSGSAVDRDLTGYSGSKSCHHWDPPGLRRNRMYFPFRPR